MQTENPETGEYRLTIPETLTIDGAAYRIVLSNERGEVQSGSIAHVKGRDRSVFRKYVLKLLGIYYCITYLGHAYLHLLLAIPEP